ncbi:hypothetical protein T492DRAFT_916417, partial [Pavlovales sp. CCMP2436]
MAAPLSGSGVPALGVPGESRLRTLGQGAPLPGDPALSGHGEPKLRTPAARPELAREAQLHEWYGDTIRDMHGALQGELASLRAELEAAASTRDSDRRAVEVYYAEQLAVCHCDALATLATLLAPVATLLARVHAQLHTEAQHADAQRAQLREHAHALEDEPLRADSPAARSDADWRERLEGLRRAVRYSHEDEAAGHAQLRDLLRDATAATSAAVAQAEAQACAMLSVVRSLQPAGSAADSDGGSASALYLAASQARAERDEAETRARALGGQLALAKRQAAHQSRLAHSRGEEATVHRHNSERMRKHLSRASERESEVKIRAAEQIRALTDREQALSVRLARALRKLGTRGARGDGGGQVAGGGGGKTV